MKSTRIRNKIIVEFVATRRNFTTGILCVRILPNMLVKWNRIDERIIGLWYAWVFFQRTRAEEKKRICLI